MSDLFLIASRNKYRFPSAKGDLTVEQLWDLPLIVNNNTRDVKVDLNTIAKTINTELQSVEENFVTETKINNTDLENKLNIVKAIIQTRKDETQKALESERKRQKRRQLVDALAVKDAEALSAASREDILKQLSELD